MPGLSRPHDSHPCPRSPRPPFGTGVPPGKAALAGLITLLAWGMSGCSGDDAPGIAGPPDPPPDPGSFSLSASPGDLTLPGGEEAGITVTVQRSGGFNGAVQVVVEGLPNGVQGSALTFAPGQASGPLTLSAASDVAAASTTVTLRGSTSAPGVAAATASVALSVVALRPVPSLGSLDPAEVEAGSEAFELVLRGEGFHPASVVRWGDASLPTEFSSETELRAPLSAEQIADPRDVEVRVETPAPGGGMSDPILFEILAPPPPPPPPAITAGRIATGNTFTCAVADDARGYCWGRGTLGALGSGSMADRASPGEVAGGIAFGSVAAGTFSACGLSEAGAAWCWGDGALGQLGQGERASSSTPVPVAGDHVFAAIAMGEIHACALTEEGRLYCWGGNGPLGRLGTGDTQDRLVPTPVAPERTFVSVSVSSLQSCALSVDGEAFCWGNGQRGALGTGDEEDRLVPTPVAGGHRFSQVATRDRASCGVTPEGVALCWGEGFFGQLGNGGTADALLPTPVVTEVAFSAVYPGGANTCGLAVDGAAWCWGLGSQGRLGNGSTSDATTPVAVVGGHRFEALSVSLHTCGITLSGEGWCWGVGNSGQLGNGATSNSASPVRVTGIAFE